MQVMTSENERTERKHLGSKVRPENDVDREMRECLTRLKVWQTENLMAPHGMDRFAEKKRKVMKKGDEKGGGRKAAGLSGKMAELPKDDLLGMFGQFF